jgi:hypothetical protein
MTLRAWILNWLTSPAEPPAVVEAPDAPESSRSPIQEMDLRVSADFSRRMVRSDVGHTHFALTPPVTFQYAKQLVMAARSLGPEPEPEPEAVELQQVDVVLVDEEGKNNAG